MFKRLQEKSHNLWTRNYSILMLGTMVSKAGTVIVDSVFGLMLLDLSGSGMLYSLLLVIGNATGFLVPAFMGARLEKKRKERLIYSLDFVSGGLFILVGLISSANIFSANLLLGVTMIYESIASVYSLAYDALFPAIVKQENYSRAYSVNSVMENLCESAGLFGIFGYGLFGPIPIMFFCGSCYIIAAVFETRIKLEKGVATADKAIIDNRLGIKAFVNNYRDVFKTIQSTHGFQIITYCTLADYFRTGAFWAMLLPYLEMIYTEDTIFGLTLNQEYVYLIIISAYSVGQFWCGVINYRLNMNGKKRFFYLTVASLTETFSLALIPFLNLFGGIIAMIIGGISSVLSLCAYDTGIVERIPEEMRSRFSGVMGSACSIILIAGNLIGGLFIDYFAHPQYGFLLTGVPEIIMMLLLIFVFRSSVTDFFDTQLCNDEKSSS